jgi:hypothetical protein
MEVEQRGIDRLFATLVTSGDIEAYRFKEFLRPMNRR